MIAQRERISPKQAGRRFKEWASLFPNGLFVKLTVYADESGTGGNSEVLIIAGFIALREEWVKFCENWQRVLCNYKAKYFHFREWADASAVVRKKRSPNSSFKKNPYKTWGQRDLDGFLFDLAEVAASDGRLVVGGYVPHNKLREDQANGVATTALSAEELCVGHFFNSVPFTINKERRVLKRQGVSFFFDHSEDEKWKKIVNNGYDLSLKKNRQFKAITFVSQGLRERVDAGDVEFLPLQAADMVAYRLRQKMEKLSNLDFNGPEWDKLDNILFKSINKSNASLSASELETILRRVFTFPKGMSYEQAIKSIGSTKPI